MDNLTASLIKKYMMSNIKYVCNCKLKNMKGKRKNYYWLWQAAVIYTWGNKSDWGHCDRGFQKLWGI